MIEFAQGPVRDVLVALRKGQAEAQSELESSNALYALMRLAEPQVFAAFLDRLIMDDECLAQVAPMSYRHVLGFDKIVLMSAPPLGRLRLHIWWPTTHRAVEHPHNHRYSSHSVIVEGKLRVHMHELGDSGELVTHYQEESASEDHRWSFVRMGTAHLVTKMVADVCAGGTYSMSPDLVHHIDSPQDLTVTLFLEMRRVRSSSDIFIRAQDSVPKPQAQQPFSVSQLRHRLRRLRVTGGEGL